MTNVFPYLNNPGLTKRELAAIEVMKAFIAKSPLTLAEWTPTESRVVVEKSAEIADQMFHEFGGKP